MFFSQVKNMFPIWYDKLLILCIRKLNIICWSWRNSGFWWTDKIYFLNMFESIFNKVYKYIACMYYIYIYIISYIFVCMGKCLRTPAYCYNIRITVSGMYLQMLYTKASMISISHLTQFHEKPHMLPAAPCTTNKRI